MLALLLDENLSPEIARQIRAKRPDIPVFSAHDREGGRLRGASDEEILRAAAEAGLTLVTYDVHTIPLLLSRLAGEPFAHSGVVLVHSTTYRASDYGSLVRALIRLYDAERDASWINRVYFLPPPPDVSAGG
ncbi:MAG: DUF5615 family PIN-like protein [Chloroherpetonaceae bacterium]|nr:DUF5615 family PIN-like protein [Chloroherpetonaceae bacterium]